MSLLHPESLMAYGGLHRAVLYNSVYRADRQLLVNQHAYGIPAAQAPVLHLRDCASTADMGSAYLSSFEAVRADAPPAPPNPGRFRTSVSTSGGVIGWRFSIR